MLPILSCTFIRFGHRTEETSLYPNWASGAAKGLLACCYMLKKFEGVTVISAILCRVSVQRSSQGNNAPISPPAFAPWRIAHALTFAIVHKCLKEWVRCNPPPQS